MKIDSHLTLVREATTPARCRNSPRSPSPQEPGSLFRDMVALVSRENQQARELQPHTLEEARSLLAKLLQTLKGEPPEALSETHRLKEPYLIRLL